MQMTNIDIEVLSRTIQYSRITKLNALPKLTKVDYGRRREAPRGGKGEQLYSNQRNQFPLDQKS
jgi:hypothetical protein